MTATLTSQVWARPALVRRDWGVASLVAYPWIGTFELSHCNPGLGQACPGARLVQIERGALLFHSSTHYTDALNTRSGPGEHNPKKDTHTFTPWNRDVPDEEKGAYAAKQSPKSNGIKIIPQGKL